MKRSDTRESSAGLPPLDLDVSARPSPCLPIHHSATKRIRAQDADHKHSFCHHRSAFARPPPQTSNFTRNAPFTSYSKAAADSTGSACNLAGPFLPASALMPIASSKAEARAHASPALLWSDWVNGSFAARNQNRYVNFIRNDRPGSGSCPTCSVEAEKPCRSSSRLAKCRRTFQILSQRATENRCVQQPRFPRLRLPSTVVTGLEYCDPGPREDLVRIRAR